MEKTIIITGASSGIGAACAKEFANNGYNIAVCYNKSKKSAFELCDFINTFQNKNCAKAFNVDVRNEKSVNEMHIAVKKEFGNIHALINNAGISRQELFTETTCENWDDMFNVHVKGAFLCTKAVLPEMINRKNGTIINISSIWGCTGASCEVAYSSAKAALIGFTKALAKEVGPSNITVNCIAPGVIETPMLSSFTQEDKATLANETPLCRIGKPDDIAKTAVFLTSENASFITGQVLCVDGGFAV